MGGRQLDERSDIYSLGAVAYYLLTGRPPFDAGSGLGVMIAHVHDPVVPPSMFQAGIPDDLERVVLRCLAKEPADRFPDAASLERALGECACSADWDQDRASRWSTRENRLASDPIAAGRNGRVAVSAALADDLRAVRKDRGSGAGVGRDHPVPRRSRTVEGIDRPSRREGRSIGLHVVGRRRAERDHGIIPIPPGAAGVEPIEPDVDVAMPLDEPVLVMVVVGLVGLGVGVANTGARPCCRR